MIVLLTHVLGLVSTTPGQERGRTTPIVNLRYHHNDDCDAECRSLHEPATISRKSVTLNGEMDSPIPRVVSGIQNWHERVRVLHKPNTIRSRVKSCGVKQYALMKHRPTFLFSTKPKLDRVEERS